MYLQKLLAYANGAERADEQVFHILKAVPEVAEERMVQVFQHSPFADYISNAFRPDNWSHHISCHPMSQDNGVFQTHFHLS
jgi:hypothetical protein